MKKKQIANIIMVAVILVIVAAGVLTVGHIRGWFDKAHADMAVLTDSHGVVQLRRDGVSFPVEKDTVLRASNALTCENGATAVIRVDGGYFTIGEKAKLTVSDPNADGFSLGINAGEVFANCTTAATVCFGEKQAEVRDKETFATILVQLKAQGITIVMVSHDVEFCAKYADMVSMFFDGQILTTDTPRRFFGSNSFYTTAANRMSRHVFRNAVTAGDVISIYKQNRGDAQ